MHALAVRAQRLPTGGEDMRLRGVSEDCLRERGDRLDQMLAIVEHDENVFVSKKGNQALGGVGGMNRESERRRDRARDERWIGKRRQIDESDAIIESCDQRVGDSHCNRRLANAAWSDDRNETMLRQSRGEQAR